MVWPDQPSVAEICWPQPGQENLNSLIVVRSSAIRDRDDTRKQAKLLADGLTPPDGGRVRSPRHATNAPRRRGEEPARFVLS
jgi:hypothetical protein